MVFAGHRGSTQEPAARHALEYLDRAVRIDPRSAEARTERGNALSRLNRHEEAIESYSKSIGMDSNHAGDF
jgi:tetratricopeptide (TPR) repeat protein